MKRTHLFLALLVVGLAFSLVPTHTPRTMVQAADPEYTLYLPLIQTPPGVQVERFTTDPEWPKAIEGEAFVEDQGYWTWLKDDPKDGYFEQWPGDPKVQGDEVYRGYITDNSGLMVAWPGWTVWGDYKLEVAARHVSPNRKSFNGLGIAFNLRINPQDHTKHQFYALMVGAGGAQHGWAVVDFTDTEAKYLTNDGYRGGPSFMENWDKWNHLEVMVIDGAIYAFCNDKLLPGGIVAPEDVNLLNDLKVGMVVSSYEFRDGLVEFKNFKLTPLYQGDPEYDEVAEIRAVSAAALQSTE